MGAESTPDEGEARKPPASSPAPVQPEGEAHGADGGDGDRSDGLGIGRGPTLEPLERAMSKRAPKVDPRVLQPGGYNFNIALDVPHHDCWRVDTLVEAHELSIRGTHSKPGGSEPAPLMYLIARKAGPLIDEFHPEHGRGYNTLYFICITSAGEEGCRAHMAALRDDAWLYAEFQWAVDHYGTSELLMAPVVHTMSDGLVGAVCSIDKHCRATCLHFSVPLGSAKEVDALLESHKAFMDATHFVRDRDEKDGAPCEEPVVLYYTVSRQEVARVPSPAGAPAEAEAEAEAPDGAEVAATRPGGGQGADEPNSGGELGGGKQGSVNYALCTVFAGDDGVEAHAAAEEEEEVMQATLRELIKEHGAGCAVGAHVIGQMWGKTAWRVEAAPKW